MTSKWKDTAPGRWICKHGKPVPFEDFDREGGFPDLDTYTYFRDEEQGVQWRVETAVLQDEARKQGWK